MLSINVLLILFAFQNLATHLAQAFVNKYTVCAQDVKPDNNCPQGWIGSQNNCYLFRQSPTLDFAKASSECNRFGAVPLRIDNREQHIFISQQLNKISVDKTLRWYTSGQMLADALGEFQWLNHPNNVKSLRNELADIWLEKLPTPADKGKWPAARNMLTYGFNGARWGWFIDVGTENRGFICQASQDNVNELLPTGRSIDYGQTSTKQIRRGPCFVIEPDDQWTVNAASPGQTIQRDQKTFVQFQCLASGNPEPSYRWYQIAYETNGVGDPIARLKRTLIEPKKDFEGRYAINAGNLVIHFPKAEKDSAKFQCEAYNEIGAIASRTVSITFGMLEEFEKQPRAPVSVMTLTSTALPCQPPSHSPTDSLNYIFNMRQNDGGYYPVRTEFRAGLFVSQANGLLGFTEVTKRDEGVYVCMVTMMNKDGVVSSSLKSPEILLQVTESNQPRNPPRIYDSFPAVWPTNPIRGERARLECFATGREALTYTWRRIDDKLIDPDKISDFGRVIEFEEVQIEDQGTYQCDVKDDIGREAAPRQVQLIVKARPYFLIPVGNQVVDIGATVTLTCLANANPSPRIRWYRNQQAVDDLIKSGDLDSTRYSEQYSDNGLTTLTITQAKKEDESMFTCLATNELGSEASNAELRVLELKPNFDKFPVLPVEGMIGSQAVMICQPEGAPEMTLTWSFNGKPLSLADTTIDANTGAASCSGSYCRLPNSNLLVNKISAASAGLYECTASNALGEAKSSAYLSVVNAITKALFPLNRVVQANTTVLLPCRVVSGGHLDVNYAWFYQGNEIRFDRMDLDARRYDITQFFRPFTRYFGTLQVTNIQFENEGQYTCDAQTHLASLKGDGVILVTGPPGPCAGVGAVPSAISQSVNVTWTVGASHLAPVEYYRIEVRSTDNVWRVVMSKLLEADTQKILTANNVDRGYRQVIVNNLGAHIAYQLRIFAGNKYGLGDPSPPSKFIVTSPKPPTMVPQNVTGGGGKQRTLVVTWQPFLKQDENGPGFFYRMHYRPKGDVDYVVVDILPKELKYVTPSVQYTLTLRVEAFYKAYEVVLQAVNDLGTGPRSEVTTVMSAARVPTNAPKDIIAGAMNCSAIQVWWNPPEASPGEGPVSGYRILYWPRVSDCRSIESDDARFRYGMRMTYYGDLRQGHIVGLDPDRYYCVGVQVFNTAGDGPESSFTEQTTFKRAPSEFPTMVKINETDEARTVRISWNGIRSLDDEESIEGYKIRYWPAGADFKLTYKDIDVGMETSGFVRDVDLNIRFFLRVYGYSRGGIGQFSSPIIIFQVIDRDRCIPNAVYEGPEIRYHFICRACGLGSSHNLQAMIAAAVYLLTALFFHT